MKCWIIHKGDCFIHYCNYKSDEILLRISHDSWNFIRSSSQSIMLIDPLMTRPIQISFYWIKQHSACVLRLKKSIHEFYSSSNRSILPPCLHWISPFVLPAIVLIMIWKPTVILDSLLVNSLQQITRVMQRRTHSPCLLFIIFIHNCILSSLGVIY